MQCRGHSKKAARLAAFFAALGTFTRTAPACSWRERPRASKEKREIAQTKGIFRRSAATGSATAADVHLLVELMIQFLLLGIVDRHLLLLVLLRRRARRKMLVALLQMADRFGRHRGGDPRQRCVI